MQPEEVAAAFDQLEKSGKVKYFGVSNMQQHQMQFLQSSIDQPLVANQLAMSLSQLDWLEEGVLVNNPDSRPGSFTPGTLEHCRSNSIQLQAWGCLSQGLFTGKDTASQSPSTQETAKLVTEMAETLETSKEAIVLSWLKQHPAGIQPIVGSTSPDRIKACGKASNIQLSREQWYQLYVSARGHELP